MKPFREYRILSLNSFDVELMLIRLLSIADRIIIIRITVEEGL